MAKIQISLSVNIGDFPDFHLENTLAKGQRDFMRNRGEWKKVSYTPKIGIYVNQYRKDGYNIFLRDEASGEFVAVLHLIPIKILGYTFHEHQAYIRDEYRGRGLFVPLFHWVLTNGLDLHSDFAQTEENNAIWQRLIRQYRFVSAYNGKFPKSETIEDMKDPKRLRMNKYVTLLFSTKWSDAGVEQFIQNLFAKGRL